MRGELPPSVAKVCSGIFFSHAESKGNLDFEWNDGSKTT
jgi:hypothetical protein